MRPKNARIPSLLIVMLPALMPAVTLPLMLALHTPDYVMGLAMGIPIGLSLVGVVWMVRATRPASCAKRTRH